MPISVDCPGCDKEMTVPDSVRGKTIRCTACDETFKVPLGRSVQRDDDDERPARGRKAGDVRSALSSAGKGSPKSRRRDDDEDDLDGEEGNSKKPMIIAAILTSVAVAGLVLFFVVGGKKAPEVAQAPNFNIPAPDFNPNPPGVPGDPFRPRPAPNFPNPPAIEDPFKPVNAGGNDPFMPKNNPPKNDEDPFQPKNNGNDPFRPKVNPVQPFQPKDDRDEVAKFGDTAWKADVDAPKEPLTLPADIVVMAPFPQSTGEELLYPTTPSKFFALGSNTNDRGGRNLYDLTTMPIKKRSVPKPVGGIAGRLEVDDGSAALSPDGKFLVAKSNDRKSFEVVSFGNGQSVRKATVGKDASVGWVDFGPTSDQVVLFNEEWGSQGKNSIQVWDVPKGEMLREMEVPKFRMEAKHYALSPNRKFLAFCTQDQGYVHRLSDGELVGVLQLPKPEGDAFSRNLKPTVEGMAFSPDGKEVAAFVKGFADKNFWVCSWDMATGKSTAEMDMTDAVSDPKVSRNYDGPQIEFMPDGKAWFVRGCLIVDRVTGIVLTRRDFAEVGFPKQRRLLPDGLVLEVSKGSGGSGVVNNRIDPKAYEVAIAAARGDSGPKLAIKKADISAVATVAPKRGAAFTAKPDTAQPKAAFAPVPVLTKQGAEANAIHFARPEVGQVLVVSVSEVTTPFLRKVAKCEKFDMVSKKSLGSFDLPGIAKRGKQGGSAKVVADLSPDGGKVAVRSLADPKRVDVFDGAGKHVVGFLPYDDSGDAVEWLGFAGEDRLLTTSAVGKLVLWDVANAKALKQCDGPYTGPLALGPGRKLLAAFGTTEVDLFDTANLDFVGSVATGVAAPERLKASLAFRTESPLLAAAIPGENNRMNLVTWDLKTGQPKATLNLSMNMLEGVQWCSESHLLVAGSELVDLDMKTIVWTYMNAGKLAEGPLPDSRAWVVASSGTRSGGLIGARLPDAKLASALLVAKGANVQTVLKPGGTVSIRIDGGRDEAQKKEMYDQLVARFQQDGFEVAQQAPIVYVVNGSESQSGETMKLTSFGPRSGGGGDRTINIPQVAGSAAWVDASNQPIWTSDPFKSNSSFFFRTFRGDEDPAVTLSKEAWQSFSGWATTVRRPTSIYRANGQPLMLPGMGVLPVE